MCIPPLVWESLLYVENRDLMDANPISNAAVDWPRFVLAAAALEEMMTGRSVDEVHIAWEDSVWVLRSDDLHTAVFAEVPGFAAAVGINMTFLLPYSMLARGWDKDFRGLAVFDTMQSAGAMVSTSPRETVSRRWPTPVRSCRA